jgi:ribA/ribD-fused uncharacterized protein
MITQTYNLQWLIDKYYNDEPLKYLYFWGHTNKLNEEAGKFCFSQWYELPFTVDAIIYKTAEHWMMANKALLFEDLKAYEKIINAVKPGEVKELGRMIMGFDDMRWNEYRYKIVVTGNIHKFNQHPQFAEYLLNTGDRILVEASPVDRIWGIGMAQDNEEINDPNNWRGLNLLGFALMEVRNFLRENGRFNYLQNTIQPPWKKYPGIHPYDIFWRMGVGETHIMKFSEYYDALTDFEKTIIKLTYPFPYHDWRYFYDID